MKRLETNQSDINIKNHQTPTVDDTTETRPTGLSTADVTEDPSCCLHVKGCSNMMDLHTDTAIHINTFICT